MILGVGIDVVELARIEALHRRYGSRLARRFCRADEVREVAGEAAMVEQLGALFAAKEAVLKALGSGWGRGLGLRQVEIVRPRREPPEVRLHAAARAWAETMGAARILLSITHERSVAAAVAVALAAPSRPSSS